MNRSYKTAPYILSEYKNCGEMSKPGDHEYYGKPICKSKPHKRVFRWLPALMIGLFMGGVMGFFLLIFKYGI